jgi:hypothetical protein
MLMDGYDLSISVQSVFTLCKEHILKPQNHSTCNSEEAETNTY